MTIPNIYEKSSQAISSPYQDRWEARSSVRSRPTKQIDFTLQGYFFPADKQPLLITKEVQAFGEEVKQEILLESFFKYLNDIVNLEVKLINAACHHIIYSDLPVKFLEQDKLNAYTVLIDEYYHVYIAKSMMLQLEHQFPNRRKLNYPISDSYYSVLQTKNKFDPQYHDIFEIIAVSIFETTLVRELVEFFNSTEVHPSIRHYVNDHMNDESRHFSFFFDILVHTWSNLPANYQEVIGQQLAPFIKLYLNVSSDKRFNVDLLNGILEDEIMSKKIVDQLYKGFEITPDIPIVRNVLNVLEKTTILCHPAVNKGFKEIGWSL